MRRLTKYFFTIFGIVCFAFAAFLIITSVGANKRCTESTTGTVSGYRSEYDYDNNSTSYFPVVEYTANRKHIEATASSGSNKTPYEIGAAVSIRYNPDNPQEFVFENDHSSVKWGIYLIVVGIGCIVLDVLSARGIIKPTNYYSRYRR